MLTTLKQQYYNIDPSVNAQLLSVQRELHISCQKVSDYCTETLFTDFSETGARCVRNCLNFHRFYKVSQADYFTYLAEQQLMDAMFRRTPKPGSTHSQKRGWSLKNAEVLIYFMT